MNAIHKNDKSHYLLIDVKKMETTTILSALSEHSVTFFETYVCTIYVVGNVTREYIVYACCYYNTMPVYNVLYYYW